MYVSILAKRIVAVVVSIVSSYISFKSRIVAIDRTVFAEIKNFAGEFV